MIIANEMSAPLRISSGPAIQHAGDLAAILSGLSEGEVFFLDEIHRMSRPAEEMLYLAMEDFRVDVVVGKGPGRDRHPAGDPSLHPGRRDHPIGSAARSAAGPVRVHGSARLLRPRGAGADRASVRRRARRRAPGRRSGRDRSSGPRHAADRQPAAAAGARLRPGSRRRADHACGWPKPPWSCSKSTSSAWTGSTGPCWTRSAAGSAAGPVGLSTLAISVAEETETVEDVAEPFLVRQGFLMRTPRGRVATAAAWQHLGLTPPPSGGDPRNGPPSRRIPRSSA